MPLNFNNIILQDNEKILINDNPKVKPVEIKLGPDNRDQSVEPVKNKRNHQEEYEEYMFIRNNSLEYLSRVLMLDNLEQVRQIAILGYNFTLSDKAITEESYLKKAKKAMNQVLNDVVDAVKSSGGFRILIETLISTTSYTNNQGREKDSTFRVRNLHRIETIPLAIYNALSQVLQKLGEDELPAIDVLAVSDFTPHGGMLTKAISTRKDSSTDDLSTSLDTIRNSYRQALENTSDKNIALNFAIEGLFLMLNAWLVEGGNASRCMILFNAVLIKLKLNPVSHGVIDFAAYIMDLDKFKAYVKYVIDLHQESK